jgi:hypothetical protein
MDDPRTMFFDCAGSGAMVDIPMDPRPPQPGLGPDTRALFVRCPVCTRQVQVNVVRRALVVHSRPHLLPPNHEGIDHHHG